MESNRRYPTGAEIAPDGGVSFRVWAPPCRRVEVVLESLGGSAHELHPDGDGYFSLTITDSTPGARYRFRLDGNPTLYPDPASRFQPEGPHGPSQVIDPWVYRWSDTNWKGVELAGQVFYEMHIGTFTKV